MAVPTVKQAAAAAMIRSDDRFRERRFLHGIGWSRSASNMISARNILRDVRVLYIDKECIMMNNNGLF